MKKILTSILGSLLIASSLANLTAYAEEGKIFVYDKERDITYSRDVNDLNHPELLKYGYYENDGYDLIYDFSNEEATCGGSEKLCWVRLSDDNWQTMRILFHSDYSYSDGIMNAAVRIPDTVNGITVIEFYQSGKFKAFDVNPENQYFKSDGQTVFSKDGKRLLSYAQYNESTDYTIPDGTELIRDSAFKQCNNLKTISVSGDVKEIEEFAFAYMDSLYRITFENFNVKIDRSILGYKNASKCTKAKLLCTQSANVDVNGRKLEWQSVDGADHYEIYQKLYNGDYKLLKETNKTSCEFPTLKSGKEYTFAVKPVAVVPSANFDEERDKFRYPESFTIEGTMSEDIVLVG